MIECVHNLSSNHMFSYYNSQTIAKIDEESASEGLLHARVGTRCAFYNSRKFMTKVEFSDAKYEVNLLAAQ
jgi:hypothetical protein